MGTHALAEPHPQASPAQSLCEGHIKSLPVLPNHEWLAVPTTPKATARHLWYATPLLALCWLSFRQACRHAMVRQHDSIGKCPRRKREDGPLVLLHNIGKDSNLLKHCVGAIGQLLALGQRGNHL